MSDLIRPEVRPPAPSDEECFKAWQEIMSLATEHCLISMAYGGIAVLMLPEEQRKHGDRAAILQAHLRSEVGESNG